MVSGEMAEENYDSLTAVFAALDHLADDAKTVAAAFATHAKVKGLTPAEAGLLNRFASVLVDYHHQVRHIEAALPKNWYSRPD